MFWNSLTGHTITLNNEAFENIMEKERMLVTSFSSFFHNVVYPLKGRFHNVSHINFDLSSANAVYL